MKTRKKPAFEELRYRYEVWSPTGRNSISYFQPLASIITDKEKRETAEKEDYDKAKAIYDKYINVGAKFRATENKGKHIAEITHISKKTSKVTWCIILTEECKKQGSFVKPVKWEVSGMISMIRQNQIEFLD